MKYRAVMYDTEAVDPSHATLYGGEPKGLRAAKNEAQKLAEERGGLDSVDGVVWLGDDEVVVAVEPCPPSPKMAREIAAVLEDYASLSLDDARDNTVLYHALLTRLAQRNA